MNFKIYHSIGRYHLESLMEIDTLSEGRIKPSFLISVPYVTKSVFEFRESHPELFKTRGGVDSGGGNIPKLKSFAKIAPDKIIKAYEQLKPEICFSPDIPISVETESVELQKYFADEEILLAQRRCRDVTREFIKPKGTKYYHVLHGEIMPKEGVFSTEHLRNWLDETLKSNVEDVDGYAMAFSTDDLNAFAYFVMFPWSVKQKNCHVLGVGSSDKIIVSAYIANKCYKSLSVDADTYVAQAIRSNNIVVSKSKYVFSTEALNGENVEEFFSTFNCTCPACRYCDKIFGTNFKADAEDYLLHNNKEAKERFRRRLVLHNVILVEEFILVVTGAIETGKLLEEVKAEFETTKLSGETERAKKLETLCETLELVDNLESYGKSKYEKKIRKINWGVEEE